MRNVYVSMKFMVVLVLLKGWSSPNAAQSTSHRETTVDRQRGSEVIGPPATKASFTTSSLSTPWRSLIPVRATHYRAIAGIFSSK